MSIYKRCLIWEFVSCDARSKCIGWSVVTVVSKPVIRGVTQSDLCIVTGFGPFNLPTCDQLQRGRDHSHCRSPAFVMFVGVGRCSVGVLFLCLVVR